jgi:hydrogenase-4 transcriptional activator
MLMELLLGIWREACRHIEIDQSIERIAQHLAEHLPADFVLVRRLDAARAVLETAAVGWCRPTRMGPRPFPPRTECTSRQLTDVLRWVRAGTVRRGVIGAADPLSAVLLPVGVSEGTFLVGPLVGDEGPLGVLVVVASKGSFSSTHETLVQGLLEPIGVALANDARLHEMARLREALEADKRALLSRLDRQDVAEAIVGEEAGLRTVMHRVEQVAATDAPVLIIGETGSGKEVVARAVHVRSRRAAAPIVRVNCGAIPIGLVDSELFGHERGSFTGAIATRQGWFERADGGTLFLDEIAELPLEAQVRLLRILQDGTFERVGGQKTLRVDVRIVAATHRNLAQMVAEGSFREDLWYRIGIFPIALPPLRERPEDVPLLAAHFARRAGVRLAGAPLTPSAADTEMLLAYPWPGNVRELAAVIERAAILGRGHRLEIAGALGLAAERHERPTPAAAPGDAPRPEDTLDAAMRRHVEGALQASAGRVEGPQGAARRLGVNPHTLRGRMRRLGITWKAYRRPRTGDAAAGTAPAGSAPAGPAPAGPAPGTPGTSGPRGFDAAMHAHIEAALAASYGRIEGPLGAAARLRINPHTLRARMRKLGIDRKKFRMPPEGHVGLAGDQ